MTTFPSSRHSTCVRCKAMCSTHGRFPIHFSHGGEDFPPEDSIVIVILKRRNVENRVPFECFDGPLLRYTAPLHSIQIFFQFVLDVRCTRKLFCTSKTQLRYDSVHLLARVCAWGVCFARLAPWRVCVWQGSACGAVACVCEARGVCVVDSI